MIFFIFFECDVANYIVIEQCIINFLLIKYTIHNQRIYEYYKFWIDNMNDDIEISKIESIFKRINKYNEKLKNIPQYMIDFFEDIISDLNKNKIAKNVRDIIEKGENGSSILLSLERGIEKKNKCIMENVDNRENFLSCLKIRLDVHIDDFFKDINKNVSNNDDENTENFKNNIGNVDNDDENNKNEYIEN